ncbi:MAG: Rrf2 family transcriptional regulator [Deltaproteobacteria bacterium]|nr:Rrf2 family transcriptional regulator [Deltaproteobacteria bacterium]
MQLSSQEEYGLRCLLQVARHEDLEPLQIAEIAQREGLSFEYTAKLMCSLRQGRLVISTRGQSGGYRLARPASEISIWEAVTVLGGPLFSDEFCSSHPGNLRDCIHSTDCSVRALWRWVGNEISKILRHISLADMDRHEKPMGLWLGSDNFSTVTNEEFNKTKANDLVQIGKIAPNQ